MAKEIERKFLVKSGIDLDLITDRSFEIVQAYLSVEPRATVRVRTFGEKGRLTVKGRNHGIERDEWEYDIPLADALRMIDNCAVAGSIVIRKTRRICGRWEIDEFHGDLQGLVTAEIELTDPMESVSIPDWIEREVSDDPRYYNSVLSSKGKPE